MLLRLVGKCASRDAMIGGSQHEHFYLKHRLHGCAGTWVCVSCNLGVTGTLVVNMRMCVCEGVCGK